MNGSRSAKGISVLLLMAAIVLPSLATPAYALTGAIWTTNADGTQVNGNIYDNKCDVYLNGGPNNGNNNTLPDGEYYFQVTDPSGATLLTSNPPRAVTVANGVFALVQLCPFADSPNNGSEYKVWVTLQKDYDTTTQNGSFGFIPSNCKTDNFKIRTENTPQYLKIQKFKDCNANGQWDPGEEEIEGWLVDVQEPDSGPIHRYYTPIEIDLPVLQDCWTVTELIPAGWMQTGLILDGAPQVPVSPIIPVCFDGTPGKTHEVVYGNIPLGSISGSKFKDCDADGVWDEGELPLADWPIFLTGTDVRGDAVAMTTSTNAQGSFKFEGLLPGTYTVTEDTSSADWLATTATSFTYGLAVGENYTGPDFGNIPLSTITACTFYDADVDGTKDTGEGSVDGIEFVLTGTDVKGTTVNMTASTSGGSVAFAGLLPGTYTLTEVLPPNWVATTPTSQGVSITCDEPEKLSFDFGDVCLEGGHGGLTLGFWSNKNGQALISAADVGALNGLNLFKPTGRAYPPFSATLATAKTQINSYLLSATAVDMRWMLSAQLIATELDVRHAFLSGSTIVDVGPSTYVPSGFITIADIMAKANTALGLGPDARAEQEYWKNLLDNVNNNRLPFVCGTPCPVVYP